MDEEERERAFKIFDRDNSGEICYEEFLRTIRGNMNDFRRRLCLKAYAVMDKDGNGKIDISDVKGTYDASRHPKVLSGEKTEDDILFEFLDTFEQNHSPNV